MNLSEVFKLVDGLGQITREEFERMWMEHSGDVYYLRESAWPRFSQNPLWFVRHWNDGKKPRFTDQVLRLACSKKALLLDCHKEDGVLVITRT